MFRRSPLSPGLAQACLDDLDLRGGSLETDDARRYHGLIAAVPDAAGCAGDRADEVSVAEEPHLEPGACLGCVAGG